MKENEYQRRVIKYFRQKKCMVIKNKADLSTGRGIPDLTVFLSNYVTIFVELKAADGKLSDEQIEIMNLINKYRYAHYYVFTAGDDYERKIDELCTLYEHNPQS